MFLNTLSKRCLSLAAVAGLVLTAVQSAEAHAYRFEYGTSQVFAHRHIQVVRMKRAQLLSSGFRCGAIGARNIHGHVEYAFRYVKVHSGTVTIRNAQELQRARLALLALKGRYNYFRYWRIG